MKNMFIVSDAVTGCNDAVYVQPKWPLLQYHLGQLAPTLVVELAERGVCVYCNFTFSI